MREKKRSRAVIGIGNEFRSDDAVGLLVARRLREAAPPFAIIHESNGEICELLDHFSKYNQIYIIDAIQSEVEAGTESKAIVCIDALKNALNNLQFQTSTHILSVATAIELARSLGALPEKLIVFGIPADDFRLTEQPSKETIAKVERAAELVHQELAIASKHSSLATKQR